MTIVEAIKTVLKNEKEGLTSKEIYNKIVDLKLYDFGAKDPRSLVNSLIRRHCYDIDFPTASPVKHFSLKKRVDNENYYAINEKRYTKKQTEANTFDKGMENEEQLPEEKMMIAYNMHCNLIKQQLLECIFNSNPAFFEQLVIDLLIKMGYGYDEKSGIKVGGLRDGGIDGIINEDKLGLSKIYIQAKRYSNKNKVGRPILQSFVGAMENIQKGVFITTSSFSDDAIKYANKQQQKSLKLINGEQLVEYMINFHVGVVSVATINTYKIDKDYFSE